MQPISIETAVRQLVATTQSGRFALYTAVHKGLRLSLANTLVVVGQTDPGDARSVEAAVSAVRNLVSLCRTHLHGENQFVHPAMEARRPGSTRATATEHVNHEASFDVINADVLAVERSTGRDREAAVAVLYQRLAFFVAANFEHMYEEETHNQAVLWDAYSDEELRGIQCAIIGSHTPEQTRENLRVMLPALSPAERVGMLMGARQVMPPEAFDGFLAFTVSLLDEVNAGKLRAAFAPREREQAAA